MIGVRTLPSGDTAVVFENERAKEQWNLLNKTKEVFGEGATTKERTLDVIVFGFPSGAFRGLSSEGAMEALLEQNEGMRGLIKRIGLPKSKGPRTNDAVVLGVHAATAANSIIDTGVVWEARLLRAEPFAKGVRSGRCFNCQLYCMHSARFCRAAERCAWCAEIGHSINNCPDKGKEYRKTCAPCGGKRGHCAIDRTCPEKAKDDERGKRVYVNRPRRFALEENTLSAHIAPETALAHDSRPLEFTWTTKTKNKRGRPTTLSRADITGTPPIASFFSGTNAQFTGMASTEPATSSSLSEEGGTTVPATQVENEDQAMNDTLSL